MKFLGRVFSFATDEDGLSLKDVVTLVVLAIWCTVIVTGLINDYTGVKLEQFSMLLESSTDLTVYVIIATLGLVATDSITNMLGKTRRVKKESPVQQIPKQEEREGQAETNDESKIEVVKQEVRSEDII